MEFIKNQKINRNIDDDLISFKKFFNIHDNIQFARAPGRVNIIGEHVDYCGYCVFPMAIENDIFMIFSSLPSGNKISLRNKNPTYKNFELDLNADELLIDNKDPQWYNYFLCGYKGIIDYANENNLKLEKRSIYVFVHGTIPPNAGLSSSSALVVCSAMVTMKCFGLDIPKKTLAKLCASCERYIGTQGGGMDQCISIMAEANSAMIIDFGSKEIDNESVSLPNDSVFVVSNSLQQMNKAASNQFNQRVVESRLAAKILLKLIDSNADIRNFIRLRDVQNFLKLDFETTLKKIDECINHDTYSREMILELLELTDEVFSKQILSQNTLEMSEFHIYKRAKHIINEANRVMQFKKICINNSGDSNQSELLGHLMNESQNSLKCLYECSSDKLDELVDICRNGGAYGSRLTGAGWGGCVISLVSKVKIDQFLNYVSENFYKKPFKDLKNEMFVTSPSDGAAFLIFN